MVADNSRMADWWLVGITSLRALEGENSKLFMQRHRGDCWALDHCGSNYNHPIDRSTTTTLPLDILYFWKQWVTNHTTISIPICNRCSKTDSPRRQGQTNPCLRSEATNGLSRGAYWRMIVVIPACVQLNRWFWTNLAHLIQDIDIKADYQFRFLIHK